MVNNLSAVSAIIFSLFSPPFLNRKAEPAFDIYTKGPIINFAPRGSQLTKLWPCLLDHITIQYSPITNALNKRASSGRIIWTYGYSMSAEVWSFLLLIIFCLNSLFNNLYVYINTVMSARAISKTSDFFQHSIRFGASASDF